MPYLFPVPLFVGSFKDEVLSDRLITRFKAHSESNQSNRRSLLLVFSREPSQPAAAQRNSYIISLFTQYLASHTVYCMKEFNPRSLLHSPISREDALNLHQFDVFVRGYVPVAHITDGVIMSPHLRIGKVNWEAFDQHNTMFKRSSIKAKKCNTVALITRRISTPIELCVDLLYCISVQHIKN